MAGGRSTGGVSQQALGAGIVAERPWKGRCHGRPWGDTEAMRVALGRDGRPRGSTRGVARRSAGDGCSLGDSCGT